MTKKILVTGGAGYIGSHVIKHLGERGEDITVIDNLSTGRKEALLFGNLHVMDLGDYDAVENLFKKEKFETIFHFAGSIVVPESVSEPLKYYENNTEKTLHLLKMAKKYGVKQFIFSSTAAVYGIPEGGVATEESPTRPINPYGRTKLMTEWMLSDLSAAEKNFRYVALRYFNVAGADSLQRMGQWSPNSTHLLKIACETVVGKRSSMSIFGDDYKTPDGTCLRDYIHVDDLAIAHVLALDYLRKGNASVFVNCGYGKGHSVKEVLAVVKEVAGVDIKINIDKRRDGDPDILVSKADKIKKLFGWSPKYNDLKYIVKSALDWERKILVKK